MMTRRSAVVGIAAATVIQSTKSGAEGLTQGFYVPAEEHPHEATFMQWPVSRRVYGRSGDLADVQATIADIANMISEFEPVIMLAGAREHNAARRQLSQGVELWDVPTEDLWTRDSGPTIAVGSNGQRVVSHIQFNGWGNKQRHVEDGQVARRVAERLGLELVPSGLIGEAGGVEQDGHGLLMAHASSWIGRSRNPGLSLNEIGEPLVNAYGAERIIWADGLAGEDITDYHIDSLARFTGPGRVLMNLPDDPDPRDPFHQAASVTHDILRDAGLDLHVIPEPITPRVENLDFVASYVNYYVCNGAVIGAQFGDFETDAIARDALQRHYPGREIVLLDVDMLGHYGGGIHCATQQLPRAEV